MSIALISVEKTLAGETWVNTHAVQIGAVGNGVPTDADLSAIGVDAVFSAASTSGGAGTTFLQRLVNFERLMHLTAVNITKVYVTDGKKNKLNPTNEFAVIPLSLAALQPMGTGTAADVVAGAVAVLINRVPIGFSVKPGRGFYRACIMDSQVQFGGHRLVQFSAQANRDAMAAVVSGAVTGSGIATHMGASGGTGIHTDVATYCIPHYHKGDTTPPPNLNGQLQSVTPVSTLVLRDVTIRQGTRGRRRRAA